jgi:hypothetical protein
MGHVVSKSHFLLALKRKVSSPARAQASTHHIMSLSCQFREGQPKNLQPINREREKGGGGGGGLLCLSLSHV